MMTKDYDANAADDDNGDDYGVLVTLNTAVEVVVRANIYICIYFIYLCIQSIT